MIYPDYAYWELRESVVFDGIKKQITINSDVSHITIKRDIYSAWKKWLIISDNTKFLPAIRVIGGDPVGSGLFAGDIYFLMNNWQIVVNKMVTVDGTLYHDNGISPFIVNPGGGIVSTVSNLVYTVDTGSGSLTLAEIEASSVLAKQSLVQQIKTKVDTLFTPNVPTSVDNALAIRAELLQELSRIDAAISSRLPASIVPMTVTDYLAYS